MKYIRTLPLFALSIAFGLNAVGGQARAQTTPMNDHSADMGQATGDAWITTKVKSELATTKGVSSTDISVQTTNGIVVLTGVLSSEIAVKKAVAVAKSVKGVKDVDASGLKAK